MSTTTLTPEQLQRGLAAEFYCDDLRGTVTVRGYMQQLLSALWEQGEGFSGKRPLGNSGWESALAAPLVRAGLLAGAVHTDHPAAPEGAYASDYDYAAYDRLVQQLIGAL